MLMYSAMFYFFGSVIFITSITPVLCCRHTTTPNNTDDQNTTDDMNITTRDWNVTTDDVNVTTDEGNVITDDVNVTTDEGNVTTDDVNVTTDEVNITTDERNVTTDEGNVTTDEGNVTTDEMNVTTDEGNVTTDDVNVTTDEVNVTTDEGNFTTDDVNVTTDDGNLTTDDGNTTQILRDSCMLLAPNDYIDELIDKLKNKTIDSIPLPDNPGSISLKEGKAWGLSTLERVGNATVHCNETITIIEVILSFRNLTGRYTWKRSVLLSELSGFVFVKAETTKILFRVSQERGNNTRITLEEFSIKEMSGIKTDLTGAGVVTWALSLVTEPAANLFKKSLANMIEGPLKDAIALALRDIDVPLN